MLPKELEPLSGIWIPDPDWPRRDQFPPMSLILLGRVNLVTLRLLQDGEQRRTEYTSYAYTVLKSVIAVTLLEPEEDRTARWRWRLDARQYLRIRFDRAWVPLVPSTFHVLASLGFDIREVTSFVAVCRMVDEPFSETAEWLLPASGLQRPLLM